MREKDDRKSKEAKNVNLTGIKRNFQKMGQIENYMNEDKNQSYIYQRHTVLIVYEYKKKMKICYSKPPLGKSIDEQFLVGGNKYV